MNDRPAPSSRLETAFARRSRPAVRPFLGLLDPVLVPGHPAFDFDGAIAESDAQSAWTWMVRDLAPDLLDPEASDEDAAQREALDRVVPELLRRAKETIDSLTQEAEDRLRVQFGGDAVFTRLPVVLHALKCRGLLGKAQAFGRAANGMTDEAALGLALQSIPLSDQPVTALLMQAAIGQIAGPSRLMGAVERMVGSADEKAIQRAGYGPLVEAILSHAQAQIPSLQQSGPFADIDLMCRAIERFHKLMRSVTGYIELGRYSRWSTMVAAVTTTMSELIEPRLAKVGPDVNLALRRHQGHDRLDSEQVLAALNGCYLLTTVRDCRDSLALNALFDQLWTQVGQALEIHIQRNLDLLRQNPTDKVTAARLEAAIKMAELRFNTEYADVLRRARDGAERRAG